MVVSGRLLGVGQSRVRGVRRDAGEIRLTGRDLWALRWIGEQYAVRMDQLGRLLGSQPGGETTRLRLRTGRIPRRIRTPPRRRLTIRDRPNPPPHRTTNRQATAVTTALEGVDPPQTHARPLQPRSSSCPTSSKDQAARRDVAQNAGSARTERPIRLARMERYVRPRATTPRGAGTER